MPLDSDSLDVLEKVRRGTPARFVLLTKGIKMVDLVVYRTGTLDTAKRRAREDGQGDFSFGVVEGPGAELSFKLATADGFLKPPTKDLSLKAYLVENGFDCKPTIEIVETLPDVPLDTGPGLAPPNRPPLREPPQPPPNRPTYRSREDWETIFDQIAKATGAEAKTQLLTQAASDLKQEKTQLETDPLMAGDPNLRMQQVGLHTVVAEELRSLALRPLPPTENQPPQKPAPQPPQNRPPQPPPQVNRPPQPQNDERRVLTQDALTRVTRINAIPKTPYSIDDLKAMLAETETDAEGDFRKVCNQMAFRLGDVGTARDTYEQVQQRLTEGRRLAQKYIKDHKDPLVGKLPARVVKRREYCQKFLEKIAGVEAQIAEANDAATAFCDTYDELLKAHRDVPYAVVEQIDALLKNPLLKPESVDALRELADRIAAANRTVGNRLLGERDDHTEQEKVEIMLGYGCFKQPDSGTSDVKLLKNPDGSIAFAFKSAKGEGPSSSKILKLPPGACSMREDLCSSITQQIQAQTGLDLGFPKSQVVKAGGTTGALIEGIRGKMYDREEMARLRETGTQQEIDDKRREMDELPGQVTPQSLQNTVLFSMMTCQWDAKWDNMMIEPGGKARPLDGGLGFPSQAIIDDLAYWDQRGRGPSLKMLIVDPNDENKERVLPQAKQPLDPQTVQALLNVDVDALLAGAQQRRDKLVQDFPDLRDDDHPSGFLDDNSLAFVKSSIQAVQQILRGQPGLTLEEFVAAYGQWFKVWVQTVRVNMKPQ